MTTQTFSEAPTVTVTAGAGGDGDGDDDNAAWQPAPLGWIFAVVGGFALGLNLV